MENYEILEKKIDIKRQMRHSKEDGTDNRRVVGVGGSNGTDKKKKKLAGLGTR